LYFLEQIIGNQRKSSSAEMLTAAFKCFSQLLESCSHFNFCDKLMNAVVRGMTTHDGEIQALCYQAVCGLFKEDLHGERSLECIRLIGKQLKTPPSGSALLAKAVDCLLSVRIEASVMKQTSDATNKIGGKKAKQLKKPHISKRKKKELKAQMEIENELKEAEAVYSQEERKKLVSAKTNHFKPFITFIAN
jgi:nucleolar complex protein 3